MIFLIYNDNIRLSQAGKCCTENTSRKEQGLCGEKLKYLHNSLDCNEGTLVMLLYSLMQCLTIKCSLPVNIHLKPLNIKLQSLRKLTNKQTVLLSCHILYSCKLSKLQLNDNESQLL